MAKKQAVKDAKVVPMAESPAKAAAPTQGDRLLVRWCLALAFLCFVLYANTLNHQFAMDDVMVVSQNKLVKQGWAGIPALLSTPHLHGYGNYANETYRPLSLVCFAIEQSLFDGTAVAGHFFNILAYAGCVVALFLFFIRLLGIGNAGVALVSAVLFAVHPVHTEVVANIKSRDELLCFLFAFLSFSRFAAYAGSGQVRILVWALLLLFLSFLSKESVLPFVFIVPFTCYYFFSAAKHRAIAITVGAVSVAVVYVGLRYAILAAHGNSTDPQAISFIDNQLASVPVAATALPTKIFILGKYLWLLLLPLRLLCNYSFSTIPFLSFGSVPVMLACAAYLTMAIASAYLFIKGSRSIWLFCMVYFLATISLFSNIPFLLGAAMAERFAFFPSAGFSLAAAFALSKWGSGERGYNWLGQMRILAVVVPVLLGMGYLTYARNPDWENNFTLYTADADKAPENSWLQFNLGNELITNRYNLASSKAERDALVAAAADRFRKSVAVYPDYPQPHAGLGNAYLKMNMLDSAEWHDKMALQLSPNYVIAINNLAGLYYEQKRYADALALCKKTLLVKPDYLVAYSNIGFCFLSMGQPDSALVYFNNTVQVAGDKSGYKAMALTYKAMGNMEAAKKYEGIAQQYFPGYKLP